MLVPLLALDMTLTTNRWQQVLVLISSSLNGWFMIHSKWLIQLVTKQIAVFINGLLNHWFKWFIHKQIHSECCSEKHKCSAPALFGTRPISSFFISLAKKKTYNVVSQIANSILTFNRLSNSNIQKNGTLACVILMNYDIIKQKGHTGILFCFHNLNYGSILTIF